MELQDKATLGATLITEVQTIPAVVVVVLEELAIVLLAHQMLEEKGALDFKITMMVITTTTQVVEVVRPTWEDLEAVTVV